MKMNQTNMIGDSAKERRIDYDLIDKLNKEAEAKARKAELEGRLAGKIKKKEEHAQAPDITYIHTPERLRDIKGRYSLENGIYPIDFEIIVPWGNILILQPGVELYFTKDAGITCEGRLEIRGKNGLEVLLTSKEKSEGWKNLYLTGRADAILNYAKFSYGKGRQDKDDHLSGGAILLESKGGLKPSLDLNNSYFENNSAYYGGAIFNDKGDVIIKNNNRFENNSADWDGGAIRNYKGKLEIDLSKNIFKNNTPDDISRNWECQTQT